MRVGQVLTNTCESHISNTPFDHIKWTRWTWWSRERSRKKMEFSLSCFLEREDAVEAVQGRLEWCCWMRVIKSATITLKLGKRSKTLRARPIGERRKRKEVSSDRLSACFLTRKGSEICLLVKSSVTTFTCADVNLGKLHFPCSVKRCKKSIRRKMREKEREIRACMYLPSYISLISFSWKQSLIRKKRIGGEKSWKKNL